MDFQKIKSFLMWCTIINGGLLVLAIIGVAQEPGFSADMQSQWFDIPGETVNAFLYLFFGVFKVLWLFFNFVPWVALVIIGEDQGQGT